jgi:urease accessory protein
MSTPSSTAATSQHLMVRLKPHAALYLLPDPVTCFEAASYNQIQHFHLEQNSSLILLDWVTSGRQSRGEDWAFARYYSVNDVIVNSTRIAKDVMLLENNENVAGTPARSTLAHKLAPYSCYGTLILRGPAVKHLIEDLRTRYKELVVFKRRSPDDFIWSLSSLSNDGIVVRMAGKETQVVKNWMCTSLARLRDVVGEDAYRKAFV